MILEFKDIEWETINNSFSERYVPFLLKQLWESQEYFEDIAHLPEVLRKIDFTCQQLDIKYQNLNELHELTVKNRAENELYQRLNDLIHLYERIEMQYPPRWGYRNGNSALDLIETDYEFFTVDRKFGYLYVMYPHVARHYVEAVLSNDPTGTIQPQTLARPNFFCWLGDDYIVRDIFIEKAHNFNTKYNLNYDINDNKLAMGFIPFAKLKNPVENLVERLKNVSN